MRDIVYIGSTPYDEECAQLGSPDYRERAFKEMRAFINQLRRVLGPEPEHARLFIKAEQHDFGTYHEVVCEFNDQYPASVTYAFNCDELCPANWDAEAKLELGL